MRSDAVNFVISFLVPTAVFALLNRFDPDATRLGQTLTGVIFFGSAAAAPFIANLPTREELFSRTFLRVLLIALLALFVSMYVLAAWFDR